MPHPEPRKSKPLRRLLATLLVAAALTSPLSPLPALAAPLAAPVHAPSDTEPGREPATPPVAEPATEPVTERASEPPPGTGPSASLSSPHIRVELVASQSGIVPGQRTEIGVIFRPEPHWHVYWENPGDSGSPPHIEWDLPDGIEVGPLLWPAPEPIRVGPLVNYGYEGEVLLRAPLTAATTVGSVREPIEGNTAERNNSAKDNSAEDTSVRGTSVNDISVRGTSAENTVPIGALVQWLVCRAEECIPGEGHLALNLPVVDATDQHASQAQPTFDATHRAAPAPTTATISNAGENHVIIRFPELSEALLETSQAHFFPRQAGWIAAADAQEPVRAGGALALKLNRGTLAPPDFDGLSGLLVLETNGDNHDATDPHTRDPQSRDPQSTDSQTRHSEKAALVQAFDVTAMQGNEQGVLLILAFAFLGGVLLNLMPCVFPVLSLKVMSFVQQGGEDPAKVRAHGWAFGAGVVLSFWALALLLIGLRAAGEQIGWGFQLQSPAFVAFLAALLTLLALSLAGVFDVGLSLTTVGGNRGNQEGYAGSFWTGALATIVATPCTAPFMGPALGFALTQTAAVSMLVFTALAVGMAAPYVALAHLPKLINALPRPGAWMETLKQFMAFPLLATVLWLLSVFELQTTPGSLWGLAAGLLLLAMAAWMFGRVQQDSRTRPILRAAVGVVALAGIWLGASAAQMTPNAGISGGGFSAGSIASTDPHNPTAGRTAANNPPTNSTSANNTAANLTAGSSDTASSEFWQPWSPEQVQELRGQGRGVFVNFTAAWCISCQVNERTIFATDDVRRLFADHQVVALKADWTNRDATIARALAAHGRDGVPLYVYYPPDSSVPPRVLAQIPTHGRLKEAFTLGSEIPG